VTKALDAADSRSVEVYGAILEGVHIAGYTFERAFGHLEFLLEADRWKSVGGGFSDVNAFIDSIHLDQFRIVAEQRRRIAQRIKELQPKAGTRSIAKMLGAGKSSIIRDTADPNGSSDGKKARQNKDGADPHGSPPGLGGAEAARLVDRANIKREAAQWTAERRATSRNAEPLPDGMELRIGDCRIALADVPDGSVPQILTDPPYGDEAAPLYEWLADFAAAKLIPGGSLICYSGQWFAHRDIAILSSKLRWWWLMAMRHDQSQRLMGKFVIANFKPVYWLVKDHRRGRTMVPDVLISPKMDKRLHDWSQGHGGVDSVIEHLSEPGELIVDPFAGTGVWGYHAVNMGRRWLGADVVEGGSEIVVASETSEREAERSRRRADACRRPRSAQR
jgi:hypothetical protein